MRIVAVRASVPVWILAFIRESAGEECIVKALGFGLMIMLGVSPAARRQLAGMLAFPADEEREGIEVPFGGIDVWPDDELPLEEVVEVAATITAMAAHDPGARADFLRLLHGKDGLQ